MQKYNNKTTLFILDESGVQTEIPTISIDLSGMDSAGDGISCFGIQKITSLSFKLNYSDKYRRKWKRFYNSFYKPNSPVINAIKPHYRKGQRW